MRSFLISFFVCLAIPLLGVTSKSDSLIQYYDTTTTERWDMYAVSDLDDLYFSGDSTNYVSFRQYLVDRFESEDLLRGKLTLYNFDGTRFMRLQQFDSARIILQKAVQLSVVSKDTLNEAGNRALLGNVFYFQGKYHRAIDEWRLGAMLFKAADRQLSAAGLLSNMGAAYLNIDYHRSAYDLFKEAVETYPDSLQNEESAQVAKINMGVALLSTRSYDNARFIFEDVLAKANSDHIRFLCFANLAKWAVLTEKSDLFYQYLQSAKRHLSLNKQYTNLVKGVETEGLLQDGQVDSVRKILQQEWAAWQAAGAEIDQLNLTYHLRYEEMGGSPIITDEILATALANPNNERSNNELYDLYRLQSFRMADKGAYQQAYAAQLVADSLREIMVDSQRQTLVYDFGERYKANTLPDRYRSLASTEKEEDQSLSSESLLVVLLVLVIVSIVVGVWAITQVQRVTKERQALRDHEKEIRQREIDFKKSVMDWEQEHPEQFRSQH